MTSSATIDSTLGGPIYAGALFTLPREVRDEIYRLVIRKRYIIYITRPGSGDAFPSRGKHEFAILQVSKAINHEVSEILYAESVFRLSMDFCSFKHSFVPAHLYNRMTNAELDFHGLSYGPPFVSFYGFCENAKALLDAATAGFDGTDIRRNHLHIRFFDCCPGVVTRLSSHLSKASNAFIGFRTVLIQVVSISARYLRRLRNMDLQESFGDVQKETTITIGQQILDLLTPTLGPAEVAVPGDVSCYILHPQDHLARSA